MARDAKTTGEEDEIRALFARMAELANKRDVQGLMALHHPQETGFLFGEPVAHEGNRRHCLRGYAALRGEFAYEFVPLKIEVGPRIAFAFGEERLSGATDAGPLAASINATYCLKKIGKRWFITHQHLSIRTPAGD